MSLGEKIKRSFASTVAMKVSQVSKTIASKPLEAILVLLIVASLFGSGGMKVVLFLFVLLYFADRWGAAERLKEMIEPPKLENKIQEDGEVDN